MARSATSPWSWPKRSLICLKWSASSTSSAPLPSVRPEARAIHASTMDENAPRLRQPVSVSVDASSLSLRLAMASSASLMPQKAKSGTASTMGSTVTAISA